MKVSPYSAPFVTAPLRLTATIIRGDPHAAAQRYLTASPLRPVGSPFDVTVAVSTPSYVASGVQVLAHDHVSRHHVPSSRAPAWTASR